MSLHALEYIIIVVLFVHLSLDSAPELLWRPTLPEDLLPRNSGGQVPYFLCEACKGYKKLFNV